jgi:carbohydrate diacid regulator
VAERLAELLCAPIWVLDEQEVVAASSVGSGIGRRFDPLKGSREQDYLRIPLRLDGQSGTVVVGEASATEVFSARLAQMLVHLVVSQTLTLDRAPHQYERKNTFIYDLLQGSRHDEAAIMREASILGLDLAAPRAAVLIEASE